MKKYTLLAATALSFLLISCNNDSEATDNTTNATVDAAVSATDLTPTLEDSSSMNTNGVSVDMGTPTSAPAANGENPYANLKGNNPAHGQPNHRCDIPEGAPLNSPPGANPAPQASAAPAPASPKPTIVPSSNSPQMPTSPSQTTAPGFSGKPNPAHGQPGHRCDIQEGAILP